MDVVILCPGQGSQKPGMAQELAAAFPAAAAVLERVEQAAGVPLRRLMAEGPETELTLTHHAQPALFAHTAAAWAVVGEAVRPHVKAAAGHSLGEFSAYHVAGALDLDAGARLVRRRGVLMYDAGEARAGAMAAILGDLHEPIELVCEKASAEAGLVVPANFNGPGQVVISGEVAAVERAMELAKTAGARRCLRLNVSGAFHSPLMEPAVEGLQDALAEAAIRDAAFPVFSNVNARPTIWQPSILHLLLRQLTMPVRWTDVVARLAALHPTALFVELGTGSVLSGLVRKIAPSVRTMTCGTPAEVEQLLAHVRG
jgi:[acyl-carrier-protein] S-malonyltransferase